MDVQHRPRVQTALRFCLMVTGLLALLGGLWSGLLRLGWTGPILQPALPTAHGPLMVCGFLGTVISLERAVALDRTWAFLAPVCTGVGAILTLMGVGGVLGPVFVTGGSLGLVAIFGVVLSIQPAPFAIVMGGGAVAWASGNGLWLTGWPVHALVPWWIGFLVLTIAGERLELSRMLFYADWTKRLFLGLTALLGVSLGLSASAPNLGFRMMGVGLGALALWLGVFDIARRTVATEGLERFIAVCLLAGYAWLLVGGILALTYGNPGAGPLYDAILHTVFVGFVFSMIFGHAPVIFPSILGVSIPYQPLFYGHVALLHGSLFLRMVGDLGGPVELRSWGAWGNAAAILLFLTATLYSAVTTRPDASPSAPNTSSPPDDIPDLQLNPDAS